MVKTSEIKKIVCLAISVILVIIACIVGIDRNQIALKAAGGQNARISSLIDMSEMLGSFNGQLSEYGYSAVGDTLNSNGTAVKSDKKYTSVTVQEQSSCYAAVTYNDQYSKMTIQRDLDIGITQSSSYYHSVLTVSSKSCVLSNYDVDKVAEYEYHKYNAYIDMEIFMSADRFLLRFNKFSIANDGKNLMGIEKVLGQWTDFTDDSDIGRAVISSLGSTNEMNFRIFAVIGDYIGRYDDDIFGVSGNVYTLEKDASKDFAKSLFRVVGGSGSLAEEYECGFEVDLSDADTPIVTLLLDNEYSNKSSVGGYYVNTSSRCYEKDTFKFTNINNTVIDIPSSVSALTAEEYSDYLSELKENN